MDKITLLSLSNDLRRITTSIQRGSIENANRFSKEARSWIKTDIDDVYLKGLMEKVINSLDQENDLKKAEDCLTYSVLLQNQALHASK